jgi:serine beta-lactamase-like protein LACTB, mitochondrial
MKKVIVTGIIFLFAQQIFPQNITKQEAIKTPKKYQKSVEAGRKMVTELMTKELIPGFSIAVGIDGKFVWSEGFGWADLENKVPVSTKSRFRIGSVSKLLTATAAAKLYEQGLLDFDASIQKYLPSFPKKEYEITSRQLLGHLAGIRDYHQNERASIKYYETVPDSLVIFQNDPLLHQPETKYAYTSHGYTLLSAVIEGVAKQNFLDVMQKEVLTPLKMPNTFPDDSKKVVEYRTRFYGKTPDGKVNNEIFVDTSDRWSSGGFVSNAEDLVVFASEMLKDGFLKPETRNLMFTSQKTKDGKETGVGLAWRIGKDSKGRKIYHHGGVSAGGRAFLIVYPDSKLVVVMHCNLTFARFGEGYAEKVAELFMN